MQCRFYQMIERTAPPSTRSAAPFVAEESGLAMNVTTAATSSVEAKRLSKELGCEELFLDARPFHGAGDQRNFAFRL
jgi:hypothetical protein